MHKKSLAIVALIVVLLAAGVFALEQTGTINLFGQSTEETKQEAESNRTTKVDTAAGSPNTDTTDKSGTTPNTPAYTPPADSSNVTISASQTNDSVVVTTQLKGYSDGTCILTATNNGRTTSQTVQVIYQTEFATCAGFTLPTGSLGTGTWSLSLNVKTASTDVTKKTTVTVK